MLPLPPLLISIYFLSQEFSEDSLNNFYSEKKTFIFTKN